MFGPYSVSGDKLGKKPLGGKIQQSATKHPQNMRHEDEYEHEKD
jgi:hypothetical protein